MPGSAAQGARRSRSHLDVDVEQQVEDVGLPSPSGRDQEDARRQRLPASVAGAHTEGDLRDLANALSVNQDELGRIPSGGPHQLCWSGRASKRNSHWVTIARLCHRAGRCRSWLGVVRPRPSSHLYGESSMTDAHPLCKRKLRAALVRPVDGQRRDLASALPRSGGHSAIAYSPALPLTGQTDGSGARWRLVGEQAARWCAR